MVEKPPDNNPIRKFVPPHLRTVLPRERLFKILDQVEHAVWISGPAGAGKSTLMASYIAARSLRCIWYRVDLGDSDLATFFYRLRMAVDESADIAFPDLPLLTPEYLLGTETFADRFFEKLCERFQRPVWLVFDNLQEASTESGLMQVMRRAVGRVAPGVKLCLISRSEPPPMMARTLANQMLSNLGWPKLAFSVKDYEDVVAMRAPGIPAASEAARQLHRKTGGWISGLVLCLQQIPPDLATCEIPESNFRIFDYFASEILHKLRPRWRIFLLQSALLDEMSAETAGRMTLIEEAENILEGLTERNFFIERRHEGAVARYRYHPLFREFLKDYLAKSAAPELMHQLYRRAAAIMVASGSLNEAVELFALARDWDGLVEVILSNAPALMPQGRQRTLQSWLNRLPESIVDQNPMLAYYNGLCILPFAPVEARNYFKRAYTRFVDLDHRVGRLLSWSCIVESYYIARGSTLELSRWLREGERLNDLLPPDLDPALSARFACGMLTALTLGEPGHTQLPVWLKRCIAAFMECPDITYRVNLASIIVLAGCLRGEINEVGIIIKQLTSNSVMDKLPIAGQINLNMMKCLFYMMTGETEKCKSTATMTVAACKESGVHSFDGLLYSYSTYAALATENMRAARGFLEKISSIVSPSAFFDLTYLHCLSAWEAYALGDLSRALALCETGKDDAAKCGWPWAILVAQVLHARVSAECQNFHESEKNLMAALEGAHTHKLVLAEFYAYLALAELRMLQGDVDAMREPLSRCFKISRTKGLMVGKWSLRSRLSDLCLWALKLGIEEDQVRLFITRHNLVPNAPMTAGPEWPFAVKFYILGSRKILLNGEPITVSHKAPRKVLELLELLICKGTQGISREVAADLLWLESDGDRSRQNVSTTLYRLRKLLRHEQAIAIRDGHLAISNKYCWVDAWHFENLLDQSEAAPNKQLKKKQIEEAVSLYQGPVHGVGGESVLIIPYSDRLKRRYERAVAELSRC